MSEIIINEEGIYKTTIRPGVTEEIISREAFVEAYNKYITNVSKEVPTASGADYSEELNKKRHQIEKLVHTVYNLQQMIPLLPIMHKYRDSANSSFEHYQNLLTVTMDDYNNIVKKITDPNISIPSASHIVSAELSNILNTNKNILNDFL